MTIEKRQTPRIEVLAELQGHTIPLDEPVIVKEISVGGLAIATRFPFLLGSVHDFKITLDAGTATIRGRVLHRRVSLERDETSYVSGIQFVEVSPESATLIRAFTERLQEIPAASARQAPRLTRRTLD